MKKNNNIKIAQVFESFPVFYQPYITLLMECLEKEEELLSQIYAFKGVQDATFSNVNIIPSYYRRKLKEKIYALTHLNKPRLNYAEIVWLHKKVDIIHIQHSYLHPKILGLLNLPSLERPKIVITLRGGDTYIKPWITGKWKFFYRDLGNKVDAFIVMSAHQKQYLQKWGVDEERIHIIPISYGQAFDLKPKYPDNEKLKIISAYRMCWEKNIEANLRTVKLLKEKGLPVHYDVYGDGPDLGQLYYLIDKYNISDVVNIKGKVDNRILKNALNNYDFYLQLSHSESFGVSVVEAQANGIPAIVSNSGGLPEAILPNKSGYCVDPHDAVKAADYVTSLWNDKEMFYKFSEAAIQYSHEHFTLAKEVEKLVSLYEQLSYPTINV